MTSSMINLVRSARKKAILQVLHDAGRPMSCEEIAAILETSPAVASATLRKLADDDNLVHEFGKVKRANRSVVKLWMFGGGEDRQERQDKKELAALDERTREAVRRGVSVLVIGGKKVYDRGLA